MSKHTQSGRLRGRPRRRGTRIRSNTRSSSWLSCRCPSLRCRANGRPRPSLARCSLVVRPPRLRPRHSRAPGASAGSPFFFRSVGRPGGVLMRPDGGAVDGHHTPLDFLPRLGAPLQLLEHVGPDPLLDPAAKTRVDRVPLAITFRDISPRRPRARAPQHPVHQRPVGQRLFAALPALGW